VGVEDVGNKQAGAQVREGGNLSCPPTLCPRYMMLKHADYISSEDVSSHFDVK
jgi:hypothetical protein